MSKPKIALAMIVKPDDEEAAILDRCLKSAHKHVDGIFLTITGVNKKCTEVGKKYGAHLSMFKWNDNFAEARNFNFSTVPEDYTHILWLDADDILVGGENLKNIAKKMSDHDIGGLCAWYLYDFDKYGNCIVKHWKTRFVRNDGSLKWCTQAGELHEDLMPSDPEEAPLFAKTEEEEKDYYFEVHHVRTDDRVEESKVRNLRIAEAQLKKYDDDPRVIWNAANSNAGMGHIDRAIELHKQFVKKTESYVERFLSLNRLANLYMIKEQLNTAEEWAWRAAQEAPWAPDGWLSLATIQYKRGDWLRSKEFLVIGMAKERPEEVHIFNPRDYDQYPMEMLMRCYASLGKIENALKVAEKLMEMFPAHENYPIVVSSLKDQLSKEEWSKRFIEEHKNSKQKEFEDDWKALPKELQTHPKIISERNRRFPRTKRPKKEIAYYCGLTSHEWNSDSEKTGIGGSEEAVINLGREWVKKGYDVIVYANCGVTERKDKYGILWRPFWMFNERDKFDILILWRHPAYAHPKYDANCVLLDMHDVIKEDEFTQRRLSHIDRILVKSEYHRSLLPRIPDEKFEIIGNGIKFDELSIKVPKKPYSLVYTSSYDRGLEHLLDYWPKIKEAVPEATLDIYYGWDVFDKHYQMSKGMMAWKDKMMEKMDQPGITEHGRVGHVEIAAAVAMAEVFAYPCHFEEIFCISAVKAQATDTVVVTTDYAALKETAEQCIRVEGDVKGDDMWEEYADKIIEVLTDKPYDQDPEKVRCYDWPNIASDWEKVWYNTDRG